MKTPDEIIAIVTPEIAILENQKNEDLKKIKKYFFVLISALLASFIVMNFISVPGYFQYFQYIIFCLILYAIFKIYKLYSFLKESYKTDFKDIVMPIIFQAFDLDIDYRKDYFIPEEEFRKSEIFTVETDHYYGEDYISGKIGKTSFELSELNVYKKISSGKREILFNGWFMIADFNKNFQGKTFLLPEVMGMQSGFLAQTIMKYNTANFELAKLEDPEFEKRFAVYTTDQIEARYILSPGLMKEITELSSTYSRDIRISFIDSKIFIGVTTNENLFNPPFSRSALLGDTVKTFVLQLMNCIKLIDLLNLNTRIWTK
jgi:hypothetical protein